MICVQIFRVDSIKNDPFTSWGRFLAIRIWLLCESMKKQVTLPVEWLPGRSLATLPKLQGADSYHISYPKLCQPACCPLLGGRRSNRSKLYSILSLPLHTFHSVRRYYRYHYVRMGASHPYLLLTNTH